MLQKFILETVFIVLFGVPTVAQDAQVVFSSSTSIPIFIVKDFYLRGDPRNGDLSNTEVLFNKMELLTISPNSVSLTEGKYLLNIGGVQDFSKTIALDVGASGKSVLIYGNSGRSKAFAYLTALSTTLLVASIPGFFSDTRSFGVNQIITTGVSALTLGFAIGWSVNRFRIVVKDGTHQYD